MFRNRVNRVLVAFALLIVMAGGLVPHFLSNSGGNAFAGAAISGEPKGANFRALISTGGDDRVKRIVYVASGSHTTGGANTPVPSTKVCGLAGEYHYAQVNFTGTLGGSAPTLAIKWQNSKDNGTSWTDVGTWTTINATVTPATQSQTFADSKAVVLMNANTPVTTPAVMYGDCWRVTYTMGASGTGNFEIIGAEK